MKRKTPPPTPPASEFRKAESGTHVLQLFVAGMMPKSMLAIANLKKICEEHLQGQYELEVIDLYQQQQMARSEQIVAVPTLIVKLPPPLRRIIGDLADTEGVLVGLGLRKKARS